MVRRSKLILVSLMLFMVPSVFSQDEEGFDEETGDVRTKKVAAPALRIGGDFGFGYRTASIPNDATGEAKEYYQGLKKGLVLGGNFSYRIGEQYGIAVQYNRFSTSSSVSAYVAYEDGSYITGRMNSDVAISFFGVGVSQWAFNKARTSAFYSNLLIGRVGFTDDATLVGLPFKQEGSTIGVAGQLGGDFKISESLCFGIGLGVLIGTVNSIDINGETVQFEEGKGESVTRFDFNVGLRIIN